MASKAGRFSRLLSVSSAGGQADSKNGSTNTVSAFINTVKSIVGTGILVMPYAYRGSGDVFGIALTVVVGLVSFYTQWLMSRCAAIAGTSTFDDTMSAALGKPGRVVAAVNLVLHQVLCCCAYLIFISKNISSVADNYDYRLIVLLATPGFVLLCWLRSMRHLSPTSLLGNLCLVAAVAVIMANAVEYRGAIPPGRDNQSAVMGNGSSRGGSNGSNGSNGSSINGTGGGGSGSGGGFAGFASLFGVVAFAFAGHTEAVMIYSGMNTRAHYRPLLAVVALVTIPLYFIFGFVVHQAFGDSTREIIFDNLSGVVSNVTKICMSVTIYFSLPLKMFPAIQCLELALSLTPSAAAPASPRGAGGGTMTMAACAVCCMRNWWITNLLRTVLAALVVVLAVAIPDFAFVVSFVGAFCLGFIAFVAPPLMYLRLATKVGGAQPRLAARRASSEVSLTPRSRGPNKQLGPGGFEGSMALKAGGDDGSEGGGASHVVVAAAATTAAATGGPAAPAPKAGWGGGESARDRSDQQNGGLSWPSFVAHSILLVLGLATMLGTTVQVIYSKVMADH